MPHVLKDKWIAQMTAAMCLTHPNVPRARIEEIVAKTYNKRVKDTKVKLYNSYENIVADTTLLGVVDWIHDTKPSVVESGVFFYPKHVRVNLNVNIIKDSMLDARDVHKQEKFDALKQKNYMLAAVKQILQLNDKKAANSGFGAEGQSSSFLYNMHSALSVTAAGRGQLSTACQCFENLLADNVKFFHMTEFLTFVLNIMHEQANWEFDAFDVVQVVPSKHEFTERFVNKFGHESLADRDMIESVYDSLDEEMRIRVFYKTNLYDFLELDNIVDLFGEIACTDVEFINPNVVPEEIAKPLNHLIAMLMEFVGYKHGVFRYEDRTRYQKRAVTLVLDTDSTFLYFNEILSHLYKILPTRLFRTRADADAYKYRVLNTLSVMCSRAIAERLYQYLDVVNVAEEDRKYVVMKNELHYSRIINTFAKKSYMGLLVRQESFIFPEPKLDVKGVNFFKSTASKDTSEFIYQDILMDQLLQPKDNTLSLRRTFRVIHKFQQRITEEIASGNMGYLKQSIKVKTPDAYANPLRIGQYKAVYVWNKIVPDKQRITLPATVTLVKVQLRNKKDAAKLENWPGIFKQVINLFDTDPEIGDYIGEDGKLVKGKGIKAIALPEDLDEVPDWVLAIIDTETLVSDNLKLFTQLYKPLGMTPGNTTHNGNSMTYYMNIVRI